MQQAVGVYEGVCFRECIQQTTVESKISQILQRYEETKRQGKAWFLFKHNGHGGDSGPMDASHVNGVLEDMRAKGYEITYERRMECDIAGCRDRHEGFCVYIMPSSNQNNK